ncbi:MAG: acylphosphatase [Betaproteobacteria bacterium]
MPTRRLSIRGRVQGVGFRESMITEARRLGVTGWVRNRLDGSVEAAVSGTEDQLEAILAWAHRGPPAGYVLRVNVAPDEGEFRSFSRYPTA